MESNTKDRAANPGTAYALTPDYQTRKLLSAVIGRVRGQMSRKQIADGMALLVGRTISVAMLNDFTRLSSERSGARFPAAWAAAFCEVTGDDSLLAMIAGKAFDGTQRRRANRLIQTLAKTVDELDLTLNPTQPARKAKSHATGRKSGAR